MMLLPKTIALILLVASTFCGVTHAQWSHNYFGTEHALDWNPKVVAIQWADGYENSSLLDLGIPSERVHKYALPGWSIIDMADGISDKTFQSFLNRLIAHDVIQFATPVFRDSCGGYQFPTRTILCRFDKSIPQEEITARLKGLGTIIESNWANLSGAYRLRAKSQDGGQVLMAANALAKTTGTIFAEPDFCFTGEKLHVPNDPRLVEMWALSQGLQLGYGSSDIDLDAIEAWDLSTGSSQIKVAVLDDGVQKDHPDLPFDMFGIDTTTDVGLGEPINQFDNHGTNVAGIIAATQNNGKGISGLVPDARLLTVRCYLSTSISSFITMSSWTVNALAWCETNGVQITNNSVVLGAQPAATTNKYDSTAAAGMMHFAAAGNDPLLGTRYPANINSVSGMIAMDLNGALASFSASGLDMAFTAPAVQVLTTDRSGTDGSNPASDYIYQQGTSFASAYGSASAALALSINPTLTPTQVLDIMGATARDLGVTGIDPTFAGGLLNAYGIAFQAALSLSDPSAVLYSQHAEQLDSLCGAAVANLGDINGDNYPDFAVGAPLFDGLQGSDTGRVRIYSGAKGNVIHTIEGTVAGETFGATIMSLGDIDLDMIPDYAIAAPHATTLSASDAGMLRVYSGATHLELFHVDGIQAGDLLGHAVVALGDINNDGRSDFAVSSPGATVGSTAGVGTVRFCSGVDGTTLLTVSGDEMGGDFEFGFAMVLVADQDADNKPDLLVGTPGATPGGTESGRVIIVSSVTGSTLAQVDGANSGDRFGAAMATWTDQNADGLRDYAIGAPGFDGPSGIDSGIVIIYESNMLTPILAFLGHNAGDMLGHSVTNGADMDSDTIEDLIIGAPGFDGIFNDCGKIYTYSTASATPRYELIGRSMNQRLGTAIASLGDIDQDGLSEMIIGAEGSSASSVSGFTAIVPARNPITDPIYENNIMAGTLGSNESGPYDTFFINNSAGGSNRTIISGISEPLQYTMAQPTGNPLPSHFALYGYLGFPLTNLQFTLPFGIGPALWIPCTATPANPIGFLITNSTFADPCPQLVASTPTPWHFTDTVSVPFPIVVTFYGIIEEGNGALKVTNSIILSIQ